MDEHSSVIMAMFVLYAVFNYIYTIHQVLLLSLTLKSLSELTDLINRWIKSINYKHVVLPGGIHAGAAQIPHHPQLAAAQIAPHP